VTGMKRRLRDRLQGITVAAAVALITGLGVPAAQAAGTGPVAATAQAGVPRYYIEQGTAGPNTVVRSTATGAVTGTVRCPWPKAFVATGEVAAAARHTFFAVCERTVKTGKNQVVVTGSRIYRVRVTGSGRATGYSLVHGGVLPGLMVEQLAVTPSGSEVAIGVDRGNAPDRPANVMVISTRTGAHALWRNSTGHAPGTVTFGIGDLSLTANGRELVFYTQQKCVPGGARPCPRRPSQLVRAVRPASRGGQLRHSRVLMLQSQLQGLSRGFINNAVITPDGSTLTVFSQHSAQTSTVSVLQVSVATGKQVRLLYRVNTGNGFSYRFFNVDPSGRHIILATGTAEDSVNGWVDHGHLVRLKPSGNSVFYEAW
jgi:hypothetical protein